MNSYFANVTAIHDPNKFVIKFTIKNYVEDAVAFPIDTFDEPNVGDPVIIYEIESIFGYSFMYKKLRVKDFTRLKLGNSELDIFEDGIEIKTTSGNDIYINGDGGITIKSANKVSIESDSLIELKGKTKLSGSVNPTGSGPFCAIKVCPYTGQPHVGNIVD